MQGGSNGSRGAERPLAPINHCLRRRGHLQNLVGTRLRPVASSAPHPYSCGCCGENGTISIYRQKSHYHYGVSKYPLAYGAAYRVLYLDGYIEILSNFFLSPAPIIVVFLTHSNSRGTLVWGGAKYTRVGKICDFRLKSPFISETYER